MTMDDKMRFYPDQISVEAGEMTPTMKMKRNVIEERYKALIDKMYRGESSAH